MSEVNPPRNFPIGVLAIGIAVAVVVHAVVAGLRAAAGAVVVFTVEVAVAGFFDLDFRITGLHLQVTYGIGVKLSVGDVHQGIGGVGRGLDVDHARMLADLPV